MPMRFKVAGARWFPELPAGPFFVSFETARGETEPRVYCSSGKASGLQNLYASVRIRSAPLSLL